MNLKVPGAILSLGCTILSTRAKTFEGLLQPLLGELGLNPLLGHITKEKKESWDFVGVSCNADLNH